MERAQLCEECQRGRIAPELRARDQTIAELRSQLAIAKRALRFLSRYASEAEVVDLYRTDPEAAMAIATAERILRGGAA